ncbi:GGDEF domain-containing protein [Rhodopseudomonas sp. HC1]|uniref:GGDEF domain-containing protein n=1 Tax=Rhodopseudomonas infernalis TaxID=2897386 RepID=UPI001EE862DA|nr:GGDEF domain-containing protein [Rhodopseudomonas infernalis]MCG6203241.1 GGDEF domain-containing protein [Rhodopseudomonas infernalis]
MNSTAATPGLSSVPADEVDWARTLAVRAKRMKQRRQIFDLVAVSYLIDAALLLMYAFADTIPFGIVPAYLAAVLLIMVATIALSEHGFHDRHKDFFLVLPTLAVNMALALGFMVWVPQAAFVFMGALLILFSVASLHASRKQSLVGWSVMTIALAMLFLLNDRPISVPGGSMLERLTTLLVLVLTIGRCMFVGMYSASLRETLYKRGVELREAYQRIEELAELDELTGAFNRRCIMRMLNEEIDRAERNGTPLSLALIDLDWFKRINDGFGHPIGDEVLRTFAITIFANIRSFDRFGRYGGEEFLLLLPNTSREEAHAMLERLREIVAELDWTAFSPRMQVTLSAGIATMTLGETADAALARSDSALYTAKEMGRNRIFTI